MTFRDVVTQDFWFHFGGLIAIGIGVFGWYQHNAMSGDPSAIELAFMFGGLAAMGVKILNGGTAMLRKAVEVAKGSPAAIPPAA